MLLAYIGPETILPVASFVAGAIGVVLMAGRRVRGWFVLALRACCGRRHNHTPRS
jgi:hypothetical protein